MSESSAPNQSALSQVNAQTITVGNITQTINYQYRPKALSTTIDSGLPPIIEERWQTRSQEADLKAYFADAQIRLVGLYAAGGFGKSALAARVFQSTTEFEKKLWANFQEPASFDVFGRWVIQQLLGVERYAQVRELYERDSIEELIIKSLNLLRESRVLLVLDNLETLFQSSALWQPYGAFLAEWLGSGGGGTIVLTSQYRLELPTAAWRWESVQGLSIEQGTALLSAQQIEGSNEDLREFVKAAGGHPLLLQLAASLLRRQHLADSEPAAIYRLRRDDLSLLYEVKEQHRGDPEACVGGILDRSFAQLDPGWLQPLLWRLSVLRQQFGLDVAQGMIEETVTLAELRKLARWSFLQEERLGDEWSFEFLPLIQRYLQQGARSQGELSLGHQRAIRLFLGTIKSQKSSLEDCREEIEIFYHWCELRQYQAAYQAINFCISTLYSHGYRNLLSIHKRLTQEWQPSNENEVYNLGGAWINLGIVHTSLGQYQDAIKGYEEALQLFLSISDREGESNSLSGLGNVYQSLGQYLRAIDLHQQCLKIKREIGDRCGEVNSLGNLGNAYQSLGEYRQAIDLHRQHYSLAREIGDRRGEANSLRNLATMYNLLAQYQQAIDFCQQSLNIAREIKDRRLESASFGTLGNAYDSLGQYLQAIDFYQKSFDIAHEIGYRRGEISSLSNLGNVHNSVGKHQRAIDFCQQSLDIAQETGDRSTEVIALINLGDAYRSLGKHQQTIEFQQQSLAIARDINNRNGEADSLSSLGKVYESLGQYQRAIEFQQQSLDIKREIGNRNGEANCLFDMANALAKLDRLWEARQSYKQAQQIFNAIELDFRVEQCNTALYELRISIRKALFRRRFQQFFWLCFLLGLAIALLIWWLKR